jgi:hypothetical protein
MRLQTMGRGVVHLPFTRSSIQKAPDIQGFFVVFDLGKAITQVLWGKSRLSKSPEI